MIDRANRARWVFGAVVASGVIALVAPAAGQGKAASALLQWSGTRSRATITTYDVGAIDGGARVLKGFRLRNAAPTKSGKLTITLKGSSAFSIALDHCTSKILGRRRWCLVSVAYLPLGAGASDSATLRARDGHGAVASLSLSGSSAGPSGRVYWAGVNGLNAVPRGGGSVTTLATIVNPNAIQWVAVDGTHVYWVDAYGPSGGSVNEVPVGGGTVTTLATGQTYPCAIAVDGTNVYWADYGNGSNGTVNEVPIGGGPVTTLATGQSYVCASMAVDGANVYWVNQIPGTVKEVPIGGGSVTTLASGQNQPEAVAADGANVYWVNWGDGTVNDVPIGGGPVTTLATGPAAPVAVAVDGTHVYWAALGFGSVNEVPIGGGAATMLASEPGTSPDSVAVDGTHVYWATRGGTVNKVRLGGGRVITLATGQTSPGSVAVGP